MGNLGLETAAEVKYVYGGHDMVGMTVIMAVRWAWIFQVVHQAGSADEEPSLVEMMQLLASSMRGY